ncbi:unnamed protein product, partial [Vitis vinifera]
MKKATSVNIAVTTAFYMLCGCMGYAAFGDLAPGNLLTRFGFYNPFWLLDIANVAVVVHLVGAYQPKPLQISVAIGFCGCNHCYIHAPPFFLQRGGGNPRGIRLLASNSLFPALVRRDTGLKSLG